MPPRLRRRMDALRSQTDGGPWSGGPVDRRRRADHPGAGLPRRRAADLRLPARDAEPDAPPGRAAPAGVARPALVPRRLRPRPPGLALLPGRPDHRPGAHRASGSARASCRPRTRCRSCGPASAAMPSATPSGSGSPPPPTVEAYVGRWADRRARRSRVRDDDEHRHPRLAADGARPPRQRLHGREPARAGRPGRRGRSAVRPGAARHGRSRRSAPSRRRGTERTLADRVGISATDGAAARRAAAIAGAAADAGQQQRRPAPAPAASPPSRRTGSWPAPARSAPAASPPSGRSRSRRCRPG